MVLQTDLIILYHDGDVIHAIDDGGNKLTTIYEYGSDMLSHGILSNWAAVNVINMTYLIEYIKRYYILQR